MAHHLARRLASGSLIAAGFAAGVYVWLVRPWHLSWGATTGELARPMPGDALVARPQLEATRAVTIGAPPAAVWPWLVQMGGYTRAGWYSYDRIDNAGRRSADTIVPELQHLDVGDVLPTQADGAGFEVAAIEPGRWLVLRIDDPRAAIAVTVQLDPAGRGHSRLVFRLRQRAPDWRGWPFLLAMDVGDFWFMRKQLLGIRERVERHWREEQRASLRHAA